MNTAQMSPEALPLNRLRESMNVTMTTVYDAAVAAAVVETVAAVVVEYVAATGVKTGAAPRVLHQGAELVVGAREDKSS